MPKQLKGTGFESVKEGQGLSHFQDAKPNGPGEGAGQGEAGRGPEIAKGGSRTSDKGSKKH